MSLHVAQRYLKGQTSPSLTGAGENGCLPKKAFLGVDQNPLKQLLGMLQWQVIKARILKDFSVYLSGHVDTHWRQPNPMRRCSVLLEDSAGL